MAGRKETISDTEILRYFEETDEPFLSTGEIADMLGFSNTGARKRLYKLAEEGLLDFKRVGRSPIFWLTAEGEETLNEN